MKRNFNLYFFLFLFSAFSLSCLNKQQKTDEEKGEIQKDTISSVKRVTDSTKIAFEDIEFGMTQDELFQTKIFKKKSKNDLKRTWLSFSYAMKERMEENNLSDNLLEEEHIIRADNLLYVEATDKIGLYEYRIISTFLHNSLYLVEIVFEDKDKLENIFEVIKSKYNKPNEFKRTENNHCIYEWQLETKNIKIFYSPIPRSTAPLGSQNRTVYAVDCYTIEIYNEDILNNQIDIIKNTLMKIELKRQSIKKKDSAKF